MPLPGTVRTNPKRVAGDSGSIASFQLSCDWPESTAAPSAGAASSGGFGAVSSSVQFAAAGVGSPPSLPFAATEKVELEFNTSPAIVPSNGLPQFGFEGQSG